MNLMLGPLHLRGDRHFEAQRLYNFAVSIEGFGEDLTLSVKNFKLPGVTSGVLSIEYGNSTAKVAGKGSISDSSITINDYIGADMEAKMWEWRKQVYDPKTQKVGWVDQYKRRGRLYQFGPDGTVDRDWILEGIWPSSMDTGDYDYSSESIRELSMTLQVDNVYPARDI